MPVDVAFAKTALTREQKEHVDRLMELVYTIEL